MSGFSTDISTIMSFFTPTGGQKMTIGKEVADGPAKGDDARQTFLDFMKKSTAQKMHELMLKQKGMTEEEYAALPPEERAKIDADIRQRIKDEAEKQVGIIAV